MFDSHSAFSHAADYNSVFNEYFGNDLIQPVLPTCGGHFPITTPVKSLQSNRTQCFLIETSVFWDKFGEWTDDKKSFCLFTYHFHILFTKESEMALRLYDIKPRSTAFLVCHTDPWLQEQSAVWYHIMHLCESHSERPDSLCCCSTPTHIEVPVVLLRWRSASTGNKNILVAVLLLKFQMF